MIPFNKPYFTGKEVEYINNAVGLGKLSGNGHYTQLCHKFFEEKYGFKKCLLTTSCTDALEMAAILSEIKEGDEVIMPSFTFVSTANAFILRGARIVFADSRTDEPNIDLEKVEQLITPRTKALVVVHYAGVSCDMEKALEIANRHHIILIEDAAQGIESFYKRKRLGTFGHISAFSFHETKNIISGEGGLLAINDERFVRRAEIIWEKGTNRAEFFRNEVNKYGWVDIGSSFLPSELTAAFLFAQIEEMQSIQKKRMDIWNYYFEALKPLAKAGHFSLPFIPDYATHNAHMFYILCPDHKQQDAMLKHLKEKGILAVFHYLPLHESAFFHSLHDGRNLNNTIRYSETIIRLPLFYELSENECQYIVETIRNFFL
ncbi:MAG: dTDP-4-amino-4,6-dideoxygalactose transaminase [Bacteroidetes bacterium HGW-Bacteroidetes-21]|jgi:dTDP-4-amino-4,6-dideoxygalactose transaminase|nr:MAG: dTDP-4-amino-4,6-dideoxygalactose transaminase [Bacteroidetes bacterium HGW-Bacteroidetes-21]